MPTVSGIRVPIPCFSPIQMKIICIRGSLIITNNQIKNMFISGLDEDNTACSLARAAMKNGNRIFGPLQ
jgi:hypothetical protein